MEDIKIRELPTKSHIQSTDFIVIEDDDGTKVSHVNNLVTTIQSTMVFNNVEDMQNAKFNEGDVVTTLGYYSKNDGGGAQYIITYAPTDKNDKGTTIYLYTSDTLRAKLVHNKKANVLQFGAYGDGTNDDYNAFKNAIATGFELEIPDRTYYLTETLEFSKLSNRVLNFNGSILNNPVKTTLSFSKCTDITIRDVILESYQGITMSECDHMICDHVDTSNSAYAALDGESGINISNGSKNIIIMNSKIGHLQKYSTSAITIRTSSSDYSFPTDIIIMNSVLTAKTTCISVPYTESDEDQYCNLTIDNCTIQASTINTRGIVTTQAGLYTIKHSIFNDLLVGYAASVAGDKLSTIITDNIKAISGTNTQQKSIFSINNSTINLYINGILDLSEYADYVFSVMTGSVYIAGEIIYGNSDNVFNKWGISTLTGEVHDYRNGYVISSVEITPTDGTLSFDDIRTMALVVTNGEITDIDAVQKVKNQCIYLYSKDPNEIFLYNSGTINLGNDIIQIRLNPYTPVILKNINNVWVRIN